MTDYVEEIKSRVLARMDVSRNMSNEEIQTLIDESIEEKDIFRPSLKEREAAREQVFYALRGLDILQELINDPEIKIGRAHV